jgi:hypothetical protein
MSEIYKCPECGVTHKEALPGNLAGANCGDCLMDRCMIVGLVKVPPGKPVKCPKCGTMKANKRAWCPNYRRHRLYA